MESNPPVSVICICYNHALYVKEAIDSVINQTYSNIEIILVNDASTDHSDEVIKKIIEQYPRIQYLKNERNRGLNKSFNRAFSQSKGDYIIDFATDDLLYPERIEKQVRAFQQLPEDYGTIYTDAEYIDEKGEVFKKHKDYLLK
ncbi:MAG: glycosyltransferase, partial [Cyclobacteriaceae bacterium]|nr:glycosyltransferase [Cyclobacteriaceae bacterium]